MEHPTVILDTARALREFEWAICTVNKDYEFYPEELIFEIFECLVYKETAMDLLTDYLDRYEREFELSEFTDWQIKTFSQAVRMLGHAIYDALVGLGAYGWDKYLYFVFTGRTFDGDIVLEAYNDNA